jgi:hypothetical protein
MMPVPSGYDIWGLVLAVSALVGGILAIVDTGKTLHRLKRLQAEQDLRFVRELGRCPRCGARLMKTVLGEYVGVDCTECAWTSIVSRTSLEG